MTILEFSVGSYAPGSASLPDRHPVYGWVSTVSDAYEPCMVVDRDARIAAASLAACELLGFDTPEDAIGRSLFENAVPLLDFTSEGAPLAEEDLHRIPPVIALTSGLLARGVLRVRTRDNLIVTMDAVSTPLRDQGVVIGSLTFFCVP